MLETGRVFGWTAFVRMVLLMARTALVAGAMLVPTGLIPVVMLVRRSTPRV